MRKSFVHRASSSLLLLAAIGCAESVVAQGFDPAKTPVEMVPDDRWGNLQPTEILGDTSWWNFGQTPTSQHPCWHDLDIENGWIFVTSGRGLMIYDGASDPADPQRWGYFFAGTETVPDWHQHDDKYYLIGVDAPAGYDGVAAVASTAGNGMLIFDTRSKSLPRLTYQDNSKGGKQVWAATYGGTHYAFYAATSDGVLIYNLSAAQSLTAACMDESPQLTLCKDAQNRNVYAGRLPISAGVSYLHGVDDFLAVSLGTLGVEIWRVSDPASPQRVLAFDPPGSEGVEGVAMWREGAQYYLALVQKVNDPPRYLRIFDVSCIAGGPCGTAVQVGTYAMSHAPPAPMLYLSFSRAGQVPFLYVGGENQFSGSPQREYLVDVRDPANPVEVTPQTHPDGYWGWYYFGNPTGYNWVMPRAAEFNGIHLVRAAFGLLDVHEYLGDLPPGAAFSYRPTTVYAGDPVDFIDRSTGYPAAWSWLFSPDGAPPASTGQSPQDVIFASPGQKTVTLSIDGGVDTETRSLTVLDPRPAVGSVTLAPASPTICRQVTLTGENVTGKPPLTYSWQILDGGGHPLPGIAGSGPSLDWTPDGTPPGTYTARLTASNASGSGAGAATFELAAPEALPQANQFTPAYNPFTAATVRFYLPSGIAGSASEWKWDFGDGTVTAWSSDPVLGPNLVHTYAALGTYTVTVSVRNCFEHSEAGVTSAGLPVTIVRLTDQDTPLAASFNSDICVAGLCNTGVDVEVTFVDASTGNITSRSWDFGDGETATGTTVKHTYRRAGTWPLTLTVSDGTNSVSFTRNVVVAGPLTEAMVIPWIAKTVDGPMLQTSDLYLHNPGGESIDVTLEFRQRGTPEAVPPKATRTIAPNATLFVPDLVKSLFNRENISGFLAVNVDRGGVQPVVVSFNTTFRNNSNGEELGQTVPGFLLSNTGAASTSGNLQVQHLVGLNDNDERIAYFGLSNPGDSPATYRLRFFDDLGQEIGTGSQQTTLSRYGFKQYQPRDIRTLFGLAGKDDYRMLVESTQGAPIFPFGANLRLGSLDPSFLTVGSGAEQVYLLGILSTPGPNNSTWRSDVVLANTSSQVVIVGLTFTNVGLASTPTDTIHETLQPGETRRLADVIGTKWNVHNGVGVLTIDSDAPDGLFPLVQGESYDDTNPTRRYGQTLPAVTAEQAAGVGQAQYLVGLREDAKSRTTFWVHNPGPEAGSYEIVFRGLDSQELGRISNVNVPAGKLRQLNKAQFPAGLTGTFTVQVIVRSGKVLTAAQVVNNKTNDPAYVQGETR